MRARAKSAFLSQADRIGFGELSAFGESLAKKVFERFDVDKDGALSFREMVVLQRALRQVGRARGWVITAPPPPLPQLLLLLLGLLLLLL